MLCVPLRSSEIRCGGRSTRRISHERRRCRHLCCLAGDLLVAGVFFGRETRCHSNTLSLGVILDLRRGSLAGSDQSNPEKESSPSSFNSADGSLSPTGKVTKQDSPTWLEIHPNRCFLVATHELSHHTGVPAGVGFVTSYQLQPDGALEKVCTQSTGGRGNTCATFDRTGRFLLVTRYWEGGISVLPFDPDTGAIGKVTAAPDHKGAGPHPLRQSAPHPHGVHGDPRTNLVYAMDLGTDKVHQYILDIATGTLAPQR